MEGRALYEAIVDIAEDYFGPAAPRFVNRLINSHLSKAPRDLKENDLPEIITWIKPTLAMLTEDEDKISEFVDRLDALMAQNATY